MSAESPYWKARSGPLEVEIHSHSGGAFRVAISDGQLTHIYPVHCRDFATTLQVTNALAARFLHEAAPESSGDITHPLEWKIVQPGTKEEPADSNHL